MYRETPYSNYSGCRVELSTVNGMQELPRLGLTQRIQDRYMLRHSGSYIAVLRTIIACHVVIWIARTSSGIVRILRSIYNLHNENPWRRKPVPAWRQPIRIGSDRRKGISPSPTIRVNTIHNVTSTINNFGIYNNQSNGLDITSIVNAEVRHPVEAMGSNPVEGWCENKFLSLTNAFMFVAIVKFPRTIIAI